MEELPGLAGGAGDALADEVGEAGDALQARGGRGAGAEDADALACGRPELGGAAGSGHRRLVPDVVVDDVALAAAFVALPADEALAVEERDRLGHGRRADLEAPDEFGRGEAARVGEGEAGHHPGRHRGHARRHEDGGEHLFVRVHRLGVASVGLRGHLRPAGRGLPAPPGAALGGAVGQVGAVGGGAAVAHDLARDGRGRAVEAAGDLRVGEAVGQSQRDVLTLPLGESASRHRGLLRAPWCLHRRVRRHSSATIRACSLHWKYGHCNASWALAGHMEA